MRTGIFRIEMSEKCKNCPYQKLRLDECRICNEVVKYSVRCEHEAVCAYYEMNYCGEGGNNEHCYR